MPVKQCKRIVNFRLPVDCQLKLFDQTIVPTLFYGSDITGFENIRLLEKVHLDFLKGILNLKSSTPHSIAYGEFGIFPLEIAGPRSTIGRAPDSQVRGPGFDTRSGHILSFLLPLIQEGQLSVTGKSMCAKYWLTA